MKQTEEDRRLRKFARREFPDAKERLQFLMEYAETRIWVIEGCQGDPRKILDSLADWDRELSKYTHRRRGDRAKLEGALLLEEVAARITRVRTKQLRSIGFASFEAGDIARNEIAPHFGVTVATLADWVDGKARRRRAKQKLK